MLLFFSFFLSFSELLAFFAASLKISFIRFQSGGPPMDVDVIFFSNILNSTADNGHTCRTQTVIRKKSPTFPFNTTIRVDVLISVYSPTETITDQMKDDFYDMPNAHWTRSRKRRSSSSLENSTHISGLTGLAGKKLWVTLDTVISMTRSSPQW